MTMHYRLSTAEKVEMIDVAEALLHQMGATNEFGVRVEKLIDHHQSWFIGGVQYVDPQTEETVLTQSAASYVHEFATICGKDIGDVGFDKLVAQCMFAGRLVGNGFIDGRSNFDWYRQKVTEDSMAFATDCAFMFEKGCK